ncbi:acyltransferase family protein [Pinibacter soli]|uniref:Acyltransferase n=1 Tax=Pinibacter soli TaxID=3044211 RepID=A0ABT6RDY7_9BACT|nr:acyltransferase [Pinibacter soli]MDI3320084.1 acyltransferase [Pinibacter soli]
MKKVWNWLNGPCGLEEIIVSRHKNNFDAIRHLAALIVIYVHCTLFVGPVGYAGAFGVPVFFFLSGLLVSQSFEASGTVKNFIWRRLLRIYPAAVVVILICALVMGPIITSLTPGDYFKSPVFFKYISSVFLVQIHFDLPGVFETSPIERSVNACLWTLPLEIKMYVFSLMWGLLKFRNKNAVLIAITLFLIFIGTACPQQAEFFFRTQIHFTNFKIFPYVSAVPMYLLGMLSYSYRGKIVVRPYWFFIGLLLFLPFVGLPFFGYVVHICIAATTLGFTVLNIKWLKKITPNSDFSYGLYIYGYPVEQLLANYAYPHIKGASLFLLIVLITFVLAFLSWNLIEKRALQFKNYI